MNIATIGPSWNLSNHWLDLPQILNLIRGDWTKIEYCLKWRRPQMEDDLKLLKVEYLHNYWLDLPQIFNLSRVDQTKIEYCLKWRWPPMEDNLKILNVEYLNKYWSDLPQILNLSLGNQTKIENCLKWDNLQWKKESESGVSQQPLIWSYSNLKVTLWERS